MTTKLRFVKTDGETDKATLRRYAKDRRAQNENRDMKEALLIQNTLSLLNSLKGETVGAGTRLNAFVYLSYSSEAPTDGLIEALIKQGFSVFCPRIVGKEMETVAFGEDFSLNERGIREPIGTATEEEMQFVITPFLAADKQGNRLGYGGGYYDRYFAKNEKAVRIGYGYDFQMIKRVPCERTDIPLDYIVTEKQILKTDGRKTKNGEKLWDK